MSLAVVPDRPMWLDVEDAMADAAGFVNLGNAQLVAVVVRGLEQGVCTGAGFVSPAHWLTVHAGVSNAHANEILRVAEQAEEFPHVMSLFRAGKLSLDQVAAAMAADPATDRRVAEFAEVATVQQIRKFVRAVVARPEPTVDVYPDDRADTNGGRAGAAAAGEDDADADADHEGRSAVGDDADGASDSDAGIGQRLDQPGSRRSRHSRSSASVSFGFDELSRFWLNAKSLTTDQGMVLEAALNEARDDLFRHGHPNVTWADALIEVCRRSLTTAGTQRAERFKTYLHLNRPQRGMSDKVPPGIGSDEENCRSHGTSGRATVAAEPSFDAVLTSGVPVPPSIRDYLTCDTLVQIVWLDGHTPIGVGKTTRTPPNRLRRLLELRDQGCAIPGCTNTLGLQAHHIVPWSLGGSTELHNLVLVCDAHHHQHHAGDITITGTPEIPVGQPGALTVTDQHGRTLRSHPVPRPPDPGDRPPNPNYRHPSGETCDYRYLMWRPPAA